MKTLSKKGIILIATTVVVITALIVTTIILTKKMNVTKSFNGTVISVEAKKKEIAGSIINWDSSTKSHTAPEKETSKCAVKVNANTYEYDNIAEGWIAACTTYKSTGNVEFVLYSDWVADSNGVFGNDAGKQAFEANGRIIVTSWSNTITMNLNGYKIDRNLNTTSIASGEVITIWNSKFVNIKNGCITGGAGDGDGGGVWVYGENAEVCFENMTITGNFTGANGGGIYTCDNIYKLSLNNTTIEGNYAEGYGGGVYCDYTTSFLDTSVLYLYNVVLIRNNKGNDYRNNLTLYASSIAQNAAMADVQLTSGSYIGVTFSRRDDVTRHLDGWYYYNHDNDQYFHCDDPNSELFVGGGTWGGTYHPQLVLKEKSGC